MDIQETVESLDIEELRKLLTFSQGDKSNEAYRGTLGILDHSDLVNLMVKRAQEHPGFRSQLIGMLQEDPLFIENILNTTSEAAQMLLSGEKLDGTAKLVIRTIKRNPELRRSFRKIYYIARDSERLFHDSDYLAFKKDLNSRATEAIAGDAYGRYFAVFSVSIFIMLLLSRYGYVDRSNILDIVSSVLMCVVGAVVTGGITSGVIGSFAINQEKISEHVKEVTEAIWQFLLQIDENVAKELSSPRIENEHNQPIGLMDILDNLESEVPTRGLDDEGMLGTQES